MRNKGVALLVAALLVGTLVLPSLAQGLETGVEELANPFWDLERDHWAFESVALLAAAGIVEGYPDGSFGGDRMFTRYEMAMVVARMLARLERLIQERVDEAVELRTDDLVRLIRETRQELAALIQSSKDELSAEIDALDARLSALEAQVAGVGAGEAASEFVPEARLVLLERAVEDLRNRLQELAQQFATKDDLNALAERIAAAEARLDGVEARTDEVARSLDALRDGMLTEEDARAIAELAIADALARRDREISAALGAAQGDADSLFQLLESRVAELEDHIDRLIAEFRPELEALGLRVSAIEERLKRQEEAHAALAGQVAENTARIDALSGQVARNTEDIGTIRSLLGNVRFTGRSETTLDYTSIVTPLGPPAVGPSSDYRLDPRDKDSEKLKPEQEFRSDLTLGIHSTPAENVDIKAELVLRDIFSTADEDGLSPGVNLEVTTPGVMRFLRVGELDVQHLAVGFDKYTFDAEAVEDLLDEDNADYAFDGPFQGADVHLVFGQNDSTEVKAFLTRENTSDDWVWGVASSYSLTPDIDLSLRAVRDAKAPGFGATPAGQPDLVVGATLAGRLPAIAGAYSLTAAYEEDAMPGSVLDLWAEFPVQIANVRVQHASVDYDFKPTFAKELDSGSNDWLERRVDPKDDLVQRGETETSVKVSRPILGVDVALSLGRRTDTDTSKADVSMDNNQYVQLEVGPFHWAGLDTSVLYDRRTNDEDEVDNTVRVNVDTSIVGTAINLVVHNRMNDQHVTASEREQRSFWVTAARDINFLVPLNLNARFASNQVLGESSTKLGVTAAQQFGPVLLKAGYSTENNPLGKITDEDDDIAKSWWKNATWTVTDHAKRDIATLGAEYTLRGFFGTDLNTAYEYRLVRVDDATHGTARNTFKVGFEKPLRGGEATLAGEGKLVTGGIPEELSNGDGAGNDRDVTAKLTLTYPVTDFAQLKLGGAYVSSKGDSGPEYTAYQVNAGVTFEF